MAKGRILIPARIRRRLPSNILLLELRGDELRLKPVKTVKLTELFDGVEVNVKDFADTHELKRALLEGEAT